MSTIADYGFGVTTDALPAPKAAAGPDTPLASVSYNPTLTTVNSSSTSFADIDATHLIIPFTVPASGQVIVVLSAEIVVIGGTSMSWNLRDGSGDIANTATEMCFSGTDAITFRVEYRRLITGLTPGAGLSWKWGHARTFGPSTDSTQYGGASGAAEMEVWAA